MPIDEHGLGRGGARRWDVDDQCGGGVACSAGRHAEAIDRASRSPASEEADRLLDGTVLAPVGIEVWREALDADVFAQGLERLGLESGHEGRERRFHPPHAIGAGCRPTPGRRRPPASSTRRPSFGKGASLRLEARGLVARARPPRP